MRDFGGMIDRTPGEVLRPASAREIADVLRTARTDVVARGCGHSTGGQPLTDGVVLDMRGLASVHEVRGDRVTVDAGATWLELLDATLPHGRTPPVLTDLLDLTIGGTLSAGGVGGASHVHGTQAATVLALDVVTPDGEIVSCSPSRRAELFDAVRAGMGRHGIITRATLRLIPAPERVLSCKVGCSSAAELIQAQRRVRADHISGQVKTSGYELKAVVYDGTHPPAGLDPAEVEELPYRDFADRMRPDVEELKAIGEWDRPHPWATMILPAAHAAAFIEAAMRATAPEDLGLSGVVLIKRFTPGWVPMLRAPSDSVLFGLLRTASPGCRSAAEMAAANRELHEHARALGGVPYPPAP
ncbi:FAD-binding protein [Actinomadura rudentiformis]|uniref:FAD-binding protein n=1 Tax=Actinomadura rudentiformis TaxID=359158 RepID=A0A6H9YGM2_9ACTN|nr:FAD-binding protein [Actinomadura rudentiformis]KAB2339613.1 FAD-binding protein [Actinomadura rudentiformis]